MLSKGLLVSLHSQKSHLHRRCAKWIPSSHSTYWISSIYPELQTEFILPRIQNEYGPLVRTVLDIVLPALLVVLRSSFHQEEPVSAISIPEVTGHQLAPGASLIRPCHLGPSGVSPATEWQSPFWLIILLGSILGENNAPIIFCLHVPQTSIPVPLRSLCRMSLLSNSLSQWPL